VPRVTEATATWRGNGWREVGIGAFATLDEGYESMGAYSMMSVSLTSN